MTVKLNRQFYSDKVFQLLLFTPSVIWLLIYSYKPNIAEIDLTHLITLVLVIPVIEEILFRGILQPRIGIIYKQKIMKMSLANLITSSIFTLLHLFTEPTLLALSTFFPSLIFGFVRERYKRLLPSIILHSSYNGGYFLIGTQLINS
jgi:membrane protease YdiL (CAAX protease family)